MPISFNKKEILIEASLKEIHIREPETDKTIKGFLNTDIKRWLQPILKRQCKDTPYLYDDIEREIYRNLPYFIYNISPDTAANDEARWDKERLEYWDMFCRPILQINEILQNNELDYLWKIKLINQNILNPEDCDKFKEIVKSVSEKYKKVRAPIRNQGQTIKGQTYFFVQVSKTLPSAISDNKKGTILSIIASKLPSDKEFKASNIAASLRKYI